MKHGILTPCKRILAIAVILLVISALTLGAAEIGVPRLEMASRGWMDDGDFVVSSRISLDLALAGGYKYSFFLGFSLEAADVARAMSFRNFTFNPIPATDPADPVEAGDLNNLIDALNENQRNQAFIGFRVAKATIQKLFNLPLSLSYFVGSGDDFCTGDDFASLFGLYSFGTEFRGFFYFPDGIGGNMLRQYNGLHGAKGTGLSLSFNKWDRVFIPMLYVYQDYAFFPGVSSSGSAVGTLYSSDLRLLFNWKWLRLETFAGVSMNPQLDLNFRAGLMLHFAAKGGEFFAQAGITGWNLDEKINVDNMFFLIEPRLHFKYLSVFVTFFYHPVEYLHIVEQSEQGMADFNIKFKFGNVESGFTVGFEAGMGLQIGHVDTFKVLVSPFGSFTTGGLLWEAKCRIKPSEFKKPKEMFDVFIGVRTGF